MEKRKKKYYVIEILIIFVAIVIVVMLSYDKKEPEFTDYQIEDIGDDQVVFVYHYANYGQSPIKDYIWIFNKEGKRKKIDLTRHWYSDVYSDDKATLLANLDQCMADDKYTPFKEKKLELTEEQINYCINLVDMELVTDKMLATGSDGYDIYVVSGGGKSREMKLMKRRDNDNTISKDKTINQVCEKIYDACYWE